MRNRLFVLVGLMVGGMVALSILSILLAVGLPALRYVSRQEYQPIAPAVEWAPVADSGAPSAASTAEADPLKNPVYQTTPHEEFVNFWQMLGRVDENVVEIVGVTMITVTAILGIFILKMTALLRRPRHDRNDPASIEETRMIQEIHAGLMSLERRVESLETLLFENVRRQSTDKNFL